MKSGTRGKDSYVLEQVHKVFTASPWEIMFVPQNTLMRSM